MTMFRRPFCYLKKAWLCLPVLLLLISGCSRREKTAPPQPQPATSSTEPTDVLAAAPRPAPGPTPAVPAPPLEKPVALRLLAPTGHAPTWLLSELAGKSAGLIEVEFYSTDAEALTKCTDEKVKYDLISITDRLVVELIKEQRLAIFPDALKAELTPPQPKFLHHYFDQKNACVWPYAWTLLGIGSPNKIAGISTITGSANAPRSHWKSWKELESPQVQVHWLNEPKVQEAARRYFVPGSGTSPETVSVDFISNLKTRAKNDLNLAVNLPAEGTLITLYHWAIVKDTGRREAVWNFLRLACAPENAAHLASENFLSVTQTAARRFLPPGQVNDPLLYPSEAVLDHAEFVRPR